MTQQRVYFNSRDKLIRLDIQRIVYFEGDGNYDGQPLEAGDAIRLTDGNSIRMGHTDIIFKLT